MVHIQSSNKENYLIKITKIMKIIKKIKKAKILLLSSFTKSHSHSYPKYFKTLFKRLRNIKTYKSKYC